MPPSSRGRECRPPKEPAPESAKTGSSVDEVSPEWAALADLAFAGNGFAESVIARVHVIAVTDLVLTEALANGHEVPEALTLMRGDGRTVSFFRLPGAGR